jgi:DNA-binding response OmpR family regulator
MYRILIIEDDFSMAHTMEGQIKSWGNQVHIVENFQNIYEYCYGNEYGRR